MKSPRGFSLVELLVALTIFSLVIFIATFAYKNFSRYWEDNLGHFDRSFAQAKGINILQSSIADTMAYVLQNEQQIAFHYFEGGASVIRAIRQKSVVAPEYPAAYELKVKPSESNPGQLALIYSETPFNRENYLQPSKWEEYSYQLELLSNIEDLNFSYYGLANYKDLFGSEGDALVAALPQWFGLYSGEDTQLMPLLVRVQLRSKGELFSFDIPLLASSFELLRQNAALTD